MIVESFLIAAFYLLIVTGVGTFLTRRLALAEWTRIPAAFIVGTALMGLAGFGLTHIGMIQTLPVLGLCCVAVVATVISFRELLTSTKDWWEFVKDRLVQNDRWSMTFVVAVLFFLVWLCLLAGTPPRSGDAMRYHLAQLSDLVRHQGFVFRPYYHYNFPMHFSMTYLPVFFVVAGAGIKFIVLGHFLAVVGMTLRLASHLGVRSLRLLSLLMFLTPIGFHEATTVTNDWPLVFFLLTGLTILCGKQLISTSDSGLSLSKEETRPDVIDGLNTNIAARLNSPRIEIVIAFIAFGIAMGIKYHAVLFLVWFSVLAINRLSRVMTWKRAVAWLLVGYVVAGTVGAPSYVRNLAYTGNPVWPMMQLLFGAADDYCHQVMAKCSRDLSGVMSVETCLNTIKSIVLDPMIPFIVWLPAFVGAVVVGRTPLRIGVGFLSFFGLWCFLQPALYWRFSVYALPIGLIVSILLYEKFVAADHVKLAGCCKILFAGSLLYGCAIGAFYSKGLLSYYAQTGKENYHDATWYYQEYDWINKNTPRDAKILAIVVSGHTYYLDREYVRADPFLSGLIDWQSIPDVNALDKVLKDLGIQYILYDECDWSSHVGGSEMMQLMKNLSQSDSTKTVWRRPVRLCSSRIRGHFHETSVALLRLNDTPYKPRDDGWLTARPTDSDPVKRR